MNSLAAIGPVISVAFGIGGIQKVSPLPKASYSIACALCDGVELRAMLAGIKIELGPLGARQRPLVFRPQDKLLARDGEC